MTRTVPQHKRYDASDPARSATDAPPPEHVSRVAAGHLAAMVESLDRDTITRAMTAIAAKAAGGDVRAFRELTAFLTSARGTEPTSVNVGVSVNLNAIKSQRVTLAGVLAKNGSMPAAEAAKAIGLPQPQLVELASCDWFHFEGHRILLTPVGRAEALES